jgi:hypothetical protein
MNNVDHFNYQLNQLFAEQCALNNVAAEFGTPCYVYSRATIERHYHAFADAAAAHPHSLVCYAVKANSNLAILNVLAKLGSGIDIVSGGELRRVIAAGGDAKKVVFAYDHLEMNNKILMPFKYLIKKGDRSLKLFSPFDFYFCYFLVTRNYIVRVVHWKIREIYRNITCSVARECYWIFNNTI